MLRQFTFAGKHIEAEVAELRGTIRNDLKNIINGESPQFVGNPVGTAELLVQRRGIKSVTVDGARHPLRKIGKDQIDIDSLPDIEDPETYEDLAERLLPEIVAVNPWLAFRAPFSEVFVPYAPEKARTDPTELPATSIAGPSSTSDTQSHAAS
jgi:hypothetical protein